MRLLTAGCLALVTCLSATAPSAAGCFGAGDFYTCTDASGNRYTVSRFGDTTRMSGSNSNTGSTWSQNSMTIGNSTYTHGQTNGNAWNETQTQYGNGFNHVYGADSAGQPYSYNCNPYTGCH
jgi:hypothetical protein